MVLGAACPATVRAVSASQTDPRARVRRRPVGAPAGAAAVAARMAAAGAAAAAATNGGVAAARSSDLDEEAEALSRRRAVTVPA